MKIDILWREQEQQPTLVLVTLPSSSVRWCWDSVRLHCPAAICSLEHIFKHAMMLLSVLYRVLSPQGTNTCRLLANLEWPLGKNKCKLKKKWNKINQCTALNHRALTSGGAGACWGLLGLVGGFDSGYIYLKFTSLHLKELVLTDRPLHQCPSMKGMNEQSDLIVLTLELKEQKYLWQWDTWCGNLPPAETARHSAAKSTHRWSTRF